MIKYILILFLGVGWENETQAQQIDSLKKILSFLRDSAKVECLHELGVQYLHKHNEDSSVYFTDIAYEESKKINYINGIAQSILLRAWAQGQFHNDFTKMRELAGESMKWYKLTSNKKGIEIYYLMMGKALFAQGSYDEALNSLNQSYESALEAGDIDFSITALETLTDLYRDRGEYDKLLETQQKIIQSERKEDDSQAYTIHELWVMGLMNMLLEEYPTALSYWRKLFLESNLVNISTWNKMEYAQLLTLSHQYDSALYYYNKFDSAKADIKLLRYFLVSKGEYYVAKKEYLQALPNFQKGLIYHRQLHDLIQVKRTLLDIARCYSVLQNNDSASKYAKESLTMALQMNSKPYIRDGYEILYLVYSRLNKTDSAYHYYRRYITMKEMVMNDQTRGKLAAYEFEHKITLLNKEKEIQQAKLQKESSMMKILIAGILGLLLLGPTIFRVILLKRRNERLRLEHQLELQKADSEKIKAELQQQATELEMQALRSQMNPHFIFNCLSSINRFILKNESEAASDYLTKFSRLVRMVLNHSKKNVILLEDELETLRLYLDLERLRFKDSFDYRISFHNNFDAASVFIPPLLLQPVVENAIWHGLMHKQERGYLEIAFGLENGILNCSITDNGVGRLHAEAMKSKSVELQKSMGIQITTERLTLLNRDIGESTFLIEDLLNENGLAAGTRVTLKIRYKESNKEFAYKL